MAEMSKGILLFDEIDNGLHHSVLVDVFGGILSTAVHWDTQVFLTTHSLECVHAMVNAAKNQGAELGLFRLEQQGDRVVSIELADDTLEAAVEMDLEVR